MEKRYSILAVIVALWLAAVTCRPIIAIGWPELILLVMLIAVLLGPLMFRLYRFLDKVQKANRAEEKKKKQD
jgi:hypothetical protein